MSEQTSVSAALLGVGTEFQSVPARRGGLFGAAACGFKPLSPWIGHVRWWSSGSFPCAGSIPARSIQTSAAASGAAWRATTRGDHDERPIGPSRCSREHNRAAGEKHCGPAAADRR